STVGPASVTSPTSPTTSDATDTPAVVEQRKPNRVHGTVELDPQRVGRDAGKIAEEIVAHLSSLAGAEVSVSLHSGAKIACGVPDSVVRIVTENGRTLKFTTQGFETD